MATLFTIQIFIDVPNAATNAMLHLVYSDGARARAAYDQLTGTPVASVRLTDDYGRSIYVDGMKIVAAQINDVGAELDGSIQINLAQARAQAKLAKAAAQDPMLSGPQIVGANGMGPLPGMQRQ